MKKNLMIRWGSAFLVSIVVLLIAASRTSPVYDLLLGDYGNNTASAAMVIGKCWAEGTAIPYRDLFSMGGPLYFFFQALGWFIAGRMGIFILEVISFTVFLGLIIQTAARFVSNKAIVLGLVSSVIAYVALCAAGNSAFEWCLPFIAGGYWIALWEKKACSHRDVLLIGILCGCVLLIDFRAGGLLYGVAVWTVFCSPRVSNGDIWKRLICCLIGIALPVSIAVCGFAALGSLSGMIQGTFLYPACALLSGFDSLQVVLHKGIKCLLLLPILVAGGVLLFREKQLESPGTCMLFSGIVCGIFLLFGDNQWYYYLAALPAVILGITLLYPKNGNRRVFTAEVFSLFLVLGLIITPLKNYISFLGNGIPDVAYEFYADAQSFAEENPEYQYFAWDTDYSYFLLLDKMPEYRYFTNQTELSSYYPAIGQEVEKYLTDGKADVVFITERGYIGRDLENYYLTQVYLEYGGSLFVYMHK